MPTCDDPDVRPRLIAVGALLVLSAGIADAGARAGDGPHRHMAAASTSNDDPGSFVAGQPTASVAPLVTSTPTAARKNATNHGNDVHGVVTDSAGRPLAHVHVGYDVSLPDAPSYQPVAVTDDHGRFAVACLTQRTDPTVPALLFSSFDAESGTVDQQAPDIAWTEAAQGCGPASGPGMTVTTSPGAAVQGTLYQHGRPVNRTGVRIGVQCDGMPRGNVATFVVQVATEVDATDGHYRIAGLRSDNCAIGVFDHPGARGREVVQDVTVTEGSTTQLDVHDNGQDYFPGDQSGNGGGGGSASPSPTPTCLAICPP